MHTMKLMDRPEANYWLDPSYWLSGRCRYSTARRLRAKARIAKRKSRR